MVYPGLKQSKASTNNLCNVYFKEGFLKSDLLFLHIRTGQTTSLYSDSPSVEDWSPLDHCHRRHKEELTSKELSPHLTRVAAM